MTAPSWIDDLETELLGNATHGDPLDLGATIEPPRTTRGKRIGVHRSPALDIVCDELVRLDDGRLMVFFPPQEAKTTTVAKWYPVWLLTQDPTLRIAVMSYSANLARNSGKAVRRTLRDNPQLGVSLRHDTQAADEWETTAGGGMVSVGIQGGLTGRPVDVLIIDDPVAGRAEAESKAYREQAWDWWENVGSTRLSPRGRVVLMMTRWHTDDLAGRILREEPSEWRVISIPAIADSPDDPLGRRAGEEFPSVQNRKPDHFHHLQKIRSPYVWQSVYQQAPVAAEGNLFKRDAWHYWKPGPRSSGQQTLDLDGVVWQLHDCHRFATVDLATSTKTSADFTVASMWAIPPNGELVLLDRFRDRVAEADHFTRMRPMFDRWLSAGDVVYVEASQHSTSIAYEAGRAGIPIVKLDADKDKLSRAMPAAGRVNDGRVFLPKNWSMTKLDEWIDEHADFPSGAHDDQVDTTAYAARVHSAYWIPAEIGRVTEIRRELQQTSTEVDLMTVPY